MGKRGLKTCPKCGAENGPRAFKCKQCSHDFMPGKKRKPQPSSLGIGRGRKACPSCSGLTGPRSFRCPHCQYEFKPGGKKATEPSKPIKKKSKRRVTDWKSLEVGSRVKVLKGSGDFFISKETNERVYMQDPGVYIVERVNEDGLVVRGKRGNGFIYMGEPKSSNVLKSIRKEPAKLLLLRPR